MNKVLYLGTVGAKVKIKFFSLKRNKKINKKYF